MKYFFIECQSNTLPLMNIIISDISKLATKTPEQPFNLKLLTFNLN